MTLCHSGHQDENKKDVENPSNKGAHATQTGNKRLLILLLILIAIAAALYGLGIASLSTIALVAVLLLCPLSHILGGHRH